MEDEEQDKSSSDEEIVADEVSFPLVQTLASGWMFDFMFVALCRHFREGKLDQYNELVTTFQNLSQSSYLKWKLHKEKTLICAFLSRVLHGKHLDVLFEEDDSVMPLMSAVKLWSSLEETVADEKLFKNIKVLLIVQAVAVCMEKGPKSASFVFKWFVNNHECPLSLRGKLSAIVAQKESHHPFLTSFSYKRLLDTIQSFLDDFLKKNPSDYLLKAATAMVQSSENTERVEDSVSQDSTSSKMSRKISKTTKRKLLPTKLTGLWKPDSCKKLVVSIRRLPECKLPNRTCDASDDSPITNKKRKPRQKWTAQLDEYLEEGVRRHGVGRWSLILLENDFKGRTGTMLKDRWRILSKAHDK